MVEVKIELNGRIEADTVGYGWEVKERKVGKHTRKLNGEVYEAPRIVLSGEFNDLIGKTFRTYRVKAVVEEKYWGRKLRMEGTAVIIFIPEKKEEVKEYDDDFDFEDDFDDEDEEYAGPELVSTTSGPTW